MSPEPTRLPFVLGMVLAVAVIILAIMTVSNTVTYTAISGIGTDISAVMDRIVGQWRLQCCRMAITIYQKQMKLFLPTWQHRRLTNASTIASIIRWQMSLILGVIHNGTANPRLDASLLR